MNRLSPPARRMAAVLPILFAMTILTNPAVHGGETLTLRLNDAMGKPGGLVALVLRTYAPRPVRDGHVCFGTVPGAGAPFTWINQRPIVFSEADDVDVVAELVTDGERQEIVIDFTSPSGTVNTSDGPLAVVYLRLSDQVAPGAFWYLELDLAETVLLDEAGEPILLEPRGGELTVRAPGDPVLMEVEGDAVQAGEVAELGLATLEPFAVASGQVVFLYDPEIAQEQPIVAMDPRYGWSEFAVRAAHPGRLVVDFESPDASLNRVPGAIITLLFPTAPDLPSGSSWDLFLDPQRTRLFDAAGRRIRLAVENDLLEIE